MPIAFDRFIEAKRGNTIDFCQVAIEHHSYAADCADHFVNLLDCDGGLCFLRHGRDRLFKRFPYEKPPLRFFASTYATLRRDKTACQGGRKSEVTIKKSRESKLTATEYALLRLFVRHPGRVLTHRHILREIWGPKSEEHRQYLCVYVTHLRQKIESDPANPSLIKTEPGIGYRFISNEAF